MTRLYLAGPMTGIAHYNFPAFDEAAAKLREAGHTVFNPAEHDRETGFDAVALNLKGTEAAEHGFSLRDTLKADLSWICDNAEGIAVLPNWGFSRGARVEVSLGQALKIPVKEIADWIPVPEEAVSFEPGLGFIIEDVA